MGQARQIGLAVELDDVSSINQYLDLVCEQSPIIRRAVDTYGDSSLNGYLHQILSMSERAVAVQPRNDLLEAVCRYATPLLGKMIAEKAAQELEILPAVLTTNHHGVDFMAQSVQGSLIFSLREVGGKPATTVPIFACGNVPLDNHPTYPQGLLLYPGNLHSTETPYALPMRLPVFSNKRRRESVSTTGAYDPTMLERAQKRLEARMQGGQLTPDLASAVATILGKDYRCDRAMRLTSYSQQAIVVNSLIWKRCFREPQQAPEMVYLELEKIAGLLLEVDLNNNDSLAWNVMFNPTLRAEVLNQLNGAKACWDQGTLIERAHLNLVGKEFNRSNCGTTFFWAINDTGRRVPLFLTGGSRHESILQGRDDRGRLLTIPFNPQDVLRGLRSGSLLPSLFTCFLTISLARGISCCGGYFQADYLPRLKHGLAKALRRSPGFAELADPVSQVPCDLYLSGMQAVMRKLDDGLLLPAGPVEIIASGGLTVSELERLRRITVRDAHLAALTETLPDMRCRENLPANWCLLLAQESSRVLLDRVVVI